MAAALALALGLAAGPVLADGAIQGRVLDPSGVGLAGIVVTSDAAAGSAVTDADGRFRLAELAAGTYDLTLTLGDRSTVEPGLQVSADLTTETVITIDWDLLFGEVLTVRAASRYPQRIVEAPAAVTSIPPAEIERQAPHGQLPKVLTTTAGAELAQGGLYDFNVNTRGFNGSTNRRVLTLLDGRDPSQAVFSGAQEWAALAFGLDDLRSVELVHGPGAALYGAGAYNGVLDLRTRAPRDLVGGRARLSAGEVGTRRAEARFAGGRESTGFVKVGAGYQESDDFVRSRVDGAEYRPGEVPREVIAPPLDQVTLSAVDLRYDVDLSPAHALSLDVGTGRLEGTTVVTGVGRLQRQRVDRPWARAAVGSDRWNLLATYTGRDSDEEISLASGGPIYLDSYRLAVEGQIVGAFAEDRGQAVGGASWLRHRVDSDDPQGVPTIFTETVQADHEAVFGQVEYGLAPRLHGVLSLRWDDSDLHDDRVSPRAALVYALGSNQSLRLTYSEAFQSPTLSEKLVRVGVAPPLDLSGIEQALAPLLGGVALGLESVPLLAVGSQDLGVEEVTSYELGYSGALGSNTFLTVSVYRSELSNFTTNLIFNLGTSLGQLVSPPPWQPPSGLPPETAALVLATLQGALPANFYLAADSDGSLYVPLLSFGSFGEVDTEGLEASVSTARGPWRFDAGISWFDYEVALEAPEHPLSPNRADLQLALGVGWIGDATEATIGYRWSDDFDYVSGVFVGPVESYSTLDLTARHRWSNGWSAGLTVSNLLDDEHYEAFGGSLIGRRALAHATVSW